MTDRKFSFLFLGLINLFTLIMTAVAYLSGSAEGLIVMIPALTVIAGASIAILWSNDQ